MTTYYSHALADTYKIAADLARSLQKGDIVSLTGELGAGKTSFAQGVAHALGVGPNVPVNSPTYTLVNIYNGHLPIYHFDWYRLASADQLQEIGFYEYAGGEGVCIIEWGEKFSECLPDSTIRVKLRFVSERERQIEIEP